MMMMVEKGALQKVELVLRVDPLDWEIAVTKQDFAKTGFFHQHSTSKRNY